LDFPDVNYFNYFTEIEQFYQSKRESFTLLSPLDWVLIESWQEQGIPLEIVLKGIERAFSRAKRDVNSLAYCLRAVSEVLKEEKEVRISKPELPEVSSEETQRYLDNLAEKTEAVAATYPEFAAKIRTLAESVRTVDNSSFRDAEQTLTALEERLISILKVAADETALVELQRNVDADLKPFRSTMTTEQLVMLEQQLWRRKLMEKHNLPRLSLFYFI
jgi:hypothetical protein